MASNNKNIAEKISTTEQPHQVKHYGDSSFVAKKMQEARETLEKFPVPQKYAK